MLGCTIFAQKKGRTSEKDSPICVHSLYIKPKDLISYYYLAGHAAVFTASWIPSNILALLTVALARLKIVMLG